MKKKIIILFIILILLFACGLVYLNQVVLPTKVKSLIVENLQGLTQKKVTLQSLSFSLFKGLVLRGLQIGDDKETLLILKEGSCSFLILPFFNKQIIIPKISLNSPQIFIERRQDSSFNIPDSLSNNLTLKSGSKNNFNVIINKIILSNASIVFQDNALTPSFKEEINRADLILWLSLPDKVKFKLRFSLAGQSAQFSSSGEYGIKDRDLKADISAENFYPQEFLPYYKDLGFSVLQGKLDAKAGLLLKDQNLAADIVLNASGLTIAKEKIKLNIDCAITATLKYIFKDKQFNYSGDLEILKSDISGIDNIQEISDLKGTLNFNNAGISADKLTASVLGIPVNAKVKFTNSVNPLLDISVASDLDLKSAQSLLSSKFNFKIPAQISGKARLSVLIESALPWKGLPDIDGRLIVSQAKIKLDNIDPLFDNLEGEIKFNAEKISWEKINFSYLGQNYQTSGEFLDFAAPQIRLTLSRDDFSLDSRFFIKDSNIRLSKFSGIYLHSAFDLTGNIDISKPDFTQANLKISSDLNLEDLKTVLKQNQTQLQDIKPSGIVHGDIDIEGNLRDWKSCVIKSRFESNALSFYGLKAKDLDLYYNQKGGVGDVPSAQMLLYDGLVNGSGKINLLSANLAYRVEANVEGLKIEKLKMDTPAKDKDIAGTIQARVKLSGFVNDLNNLSGAGKILISNGKLWELDLFRGLGSLLFTHDFSRILFSQGSCDFNIKNKYIFTDNLSLKSNLSNIAGSVKIGFDSSLDASLNVQVNQDIPLSGTLRDVTTAIMGNSGRFGLIRITGTLQKPRYDFKAAVTDILKGLTDTFLKIND